MTSQESTFAIGVLLRLTTKTEGGRSSPILGGWRDETRWQFRPNWGLPGMLPPHQAAAPVLAFDQENIQPGDTVRAVIVPVFPETPEWAEVSAGTDLVMYEGLRVCGHARVLWQRTTMERVPPSDIDTYIRWLSEGSELDEPQPQAGVRSLLPEDRAEAAT